MGYLDKEQDVENLSKLLKLMVGREIKTRGGKRYTITREDISLALTK
jgi:histone H3/H4